MHERTAATVSLPQADVASSKHAPPLPAAPSGALMRAGGMAKKTLHHSSESLILPVGPGPGIGLERARENEYKTE